MIKKFLVLTAAGAMSVFALSGISPNNPNPTDVGAPPGSEASLASLLGCGSGDLCFGTGNYVITGQTGVGLWSENPASGTISPKLQFTFTGGSDTIGMFDGNTPTDMATLFGPITGSVTGGTKQTVTVSWNADGTSGTVVNLTTLTSTTFTGISEGDFGFYLKQGTNVYYSASNLNSPTSTSGATFTGNSWTTPISGETSTQTRVLSYNLPTPTLWAIAFEDGTDFDYNDQVFTVESITAVPEPTSIVLLGGALLLAGRSLRKKFQKV